MDVADGDSSELGDRAVLASCEIQTRHRMGVRRQFIRTIFLRTWSLCLHRLSDAYRASGIQSISLRNHDGIHGGGNFASWNCERILASVDGIRELFFDEFFNSNSGLSDDLLLALGRQSVRTALSRFKTLTRPSISSLKSMCVQKVDSRATSS